VAALDEAPSLDLVRPPLLAGRTGKEVPHASIG
jgi:hypothetical protein